MRRFVAWAEAVPTIGREMLAIHARGPGAAPVLFFRPWSWLLPERTGGN